jgi:hypothetical protein
MLMGMWELFSTLDSDPEVDVFPGFLMASNAKVFSKLIEQSLQHNPIPIEKLKPIAISQVLRDTETRSLQKAAILRQHFHKRNLETPIVAIYGKKATTAPRLKGKASLEFRSPRWR